VVYARYLLEHVADPAAVVSEMRRVLRPGGRIALQENDISLLRVDPPCPAFEEVWAAFAACQRQLGGDALIGRRLFRLLHNAGFASVEINVQPEVHWHGSPGFESWIRNIIGNIAGATGLGRSGLCTPARIDEAVSELEDLMQREDASSIFVWNRAAARR
jgi:SAM-dependent methyltransferase